MSTTSRTALASEGMNWALQSWGLRARTAAPALSTVPRLEPDLKRLEPLEVDADTSFDQIRELHRPGGVPVIIRGGAHTWDATKTWSLDMLAERFGDHQVPTDDRGPDGQTVTLPLSECIQRTRSGNGGYSRFSPLMAEHPELIDDLDLAALLSMSGDNGKRTLFQMFIGGAGTGTETHCAVGNNAFVQVHGEKDWWFVPPQYTAALHPLPFGRPYFASVATLHDPTLDTHPDAPVYPVHLEQGDIMLIPPFWWHQVSNPSDSIGVASRWHHLVHAFSQSAFLALMTLTANNPNIITANKDRRRFGYVYQETIDQADELLGPRPLIAA